MTEKPTVTALPTITNEPAVTITPVPEKRIAQNLKVKYDSKSNQKRLKRKVGSRIVQEITGSKTKVTFSSSNTKAAKVDKTSGVISCVGVGRTVITVKAEESRQYKAASKRITIYVIPKDVKIKSLKSNKKAQVTLKCRNKAEGYTYQIEYMCGKKIKKVTLKGKKNAEKTFKKLKSGKKFRVRIRAYKKTGGTVYYGKYSKWKSCKIK